MGSAHANSELSSQRASRKDFFPNFRTCRLNLFSFKKSFHSYLLPRPSSFARRANPENAHITSSGQHHALYYYLSRVTSDLGAYSHGYSR